MRMVLVLLVALEFSAQGQGVLGFWNVGASPDQKVYIDEWLNPSALAPGGNQFLVALYFARPEDGESALTQLGLAAGFIGGPEERSGIFFGPSRTIPGYTGLFQVKGWESAFGTTYEEAATNPAARVGQSVVFTAYGAPPGEPAGSLIQHSLGAFRGFVIAIPEPSTTLLTVTGLVTLVLVLRRRLSGS